MKVSDQKKEVLKESVDKTFLGLSGGVWCVLAGLCYGTQNVFAKLAFKRGLSVTRFTMIRHLMLTIGSVICGKIRGVNLDPRRYAPFLVAVLLVRAVLGMLSKLF